MLFKDLSRLTLLNQNQQSAKGKQITDREEKLSLLGSCDLVLQLMSVLGNYLNVFPTIKSKCEVEAFSRIILLSCRWHGLIPPWLRQGSAWSLELQ